MEKILALFLAVLLGFTSVPFDRQIKGTVSETETVTETEDAAETEDVTETEDAAETEDSGETEGTEDNEDTGNVKDFIWDGETVPETFDLRSVDCDGDGIGDRCYVTPVRLQNPFGTCWGFAAIAAAEISLLGSVYSYDPDAWTWLDLSEKQLAYFSHMPLNDPDHPQSGEGTQPASMENFKMGDIYTGGTPFMATSVFAQGIGPSEEKNDDLGDLFVYHGKEKLLAQTYFDGGFHFFSYSDEDDWTIPEEYRFTQDYVLTEGRLLPNPAGRNESGEYEYNASATLEIKKQLLQKKGVNVGFCADTSRPDQESNTQGTYISYNWAHYTYEAAQSNHAVTIVGWDDHYSASNFIEGHQPPADGAWLVKNSWGSGENEFPNKGNGTWGIRVQKKDENGEPEVDENGDPVMVGSGYFWLSYYDQSFKMVESFDFSDEVAPEIVDQYDYLAVNDLMVEESSDEIKMANVFRARHSQYLISISCLTQAENSEVHYDIYLLPEDFESPDEGLKVASGDEAYRFGGLHRIDLEEDILIQKNQQYAIVITVKQGDQYLVYEPKGQTLSTILNQKAIINSRESFIFDGSRWDDYKELAESKGAEDNEMMAVFGATSSYDNFPIKGYSRRVTGDIHMVPKLQNSLLYLIDGLDETDATVSFVSIDAFELGDLDIEWKLENGSEEYVDLIPDEASNDTKVVIRAKDAGTATILIDAGNYGKSVVRIKVGYGDPVSMIISEPFATYTGEPIEPYAFVLAENAKLLTQNEHYTLEYDDNVNCGLVTVRAIGKNHDRQKEGAAAPEAYFVILPPAPEIESASVEDGSLTVKVNDLYSIGISGYQLEYRQSGTEDWTASEITDGRTEFVIEGLAAGEYEIRACAFVSVPTVDSFPEPFEGNYNGEYSEVGTIAE